MTDLGHYSLGLAFFAELSKQQQSPSIEDGVVPGSVVYTCKHYRREMRNIKVPSDVYITVVGTDLIRDPDGNFVVLEE